MVLGRSILDMSKLQNVKWSGSSLRFPRLAFIIAAICLWGVFALSAWQCYKDLKKSGDLRLIHRSQVTVHEVKRKRQSDTDDPYIALVSIKEMPMVVFFDFKKNSQDFFILEDKTKEPLIESYYGKNLKVYSVYKNRFSFYFSQLIGVLISGALAILFTLVSRDLVFCKAIESGQRKPFIISIEKGALNGSEEQKGVKRTG